MSASGTPFELKIRTATACLLLFSHFGLAMAADGRVEISQACAEVGCFDGDNSGFPVQIVNPGSYVLTNDLNITGVGSPHNRTVIAIQAEASGTVIDMNGFSIIGPNSCTGDPVTSCDNNGSGDRGIQDSIATGISSNFFRPSDDVNFQSAHQLGPNLCGTIICP